jgi:dihydroxyacetone kinase-like predicted kinase
VTGGDLAEALKIGTELAYRSVLEPVEGTMLSVIRVAADAALSAASDDLGFVLDRACDAARRELALTRSQLPALAEAGVIDAGGLGIVDLLYGLSGRPSDASIATGKANARACRHEEEIGLCTNFLISGSGIDVAAVRRELAWLGTSVVIAGDETRVKVHLHTDDPEPVLEKARRFGTVESISIEDMSAQIEERAGRLAKPDEPSHRVVAIAESKSLQAIYRSLGVTASPPPRPDRDHSEWLRALAKPDVALILLTDDHQLRSTLGHCEASGVHLPETPSIPAVLGAIAAYRVEDELAQALARMNAAAAAVRSAKVLVDSAGSSPSFVATMGDERISSADDEMRALEMALEAVNANEAELITVVVGAEATLGSSLSDRLQLMYPSAELDILQGSQHQSLYAIGIE